MAVAQLKKKTSVRKAYHLFSLLVDLIKEGLGVIRPLVRSVDAPQAHASNVSRQVRGADAYLIVVRVVCCV